MGRIWAALLLGLSACASPPMYWAKPGTGLQQTAVDLSACRTEGNSGGQKVFSARELETPCMVGKGYALGNSPPR